MPNNIAKQFKSDLKALLKKYNACIQFDTAPGSDLIGVYDGHFDVLINGNIVRLTPDPDSYCLSDRDL